MDKITEKIGWLGSILLAICGLPEAYFAITTGTTSLSYIFLILWGSGEIFTLFYLTQKNKKIKLLPLFLNYGLNIVFISILLIIKSGLFT